MTTFTKESKIRRSRDGVIFGVCQGIAKSRDLPVFYIRLTLVLILVFTGFFPIALLYLAAGLILPLEDSGFQESSSFNDDFNREKQREESRKHFNASREQEWDQKFYSS